MNQTHSHDGEGIRLATGVIAVVLLCVVGSIVIVTDHTVVAPSEITSLGMTSLLAPMETRALPRDGRGDAVASAAATPGEVGTDRTAGVPAGRLYPEPASDAARDEDGHPPSF